MEEQRSQFVKYDFYKLDPQWRRLPSSEKEEHKQEFIAVLDELSADVSVLPYSLVGLRGDCDFLLWKVAPDLDQLQEMGTRLWRTNLGKHLEIPYSFLSMTRHSPYVGAHRHPGQEGTTASIRQIGRKYLFVYPFTKTHSWYQLSAEDRQSMMTDHFSVGHKYPTVKITTTYSYGLDDQEFMLGFETDTPKDFLELVIDLRGSEARPYTERDTPIFTCIARDLAETLDSLG
jgi:chlorite dismutase